jgi:hypothetical protein
MWRAIAITPLALTKEKPMRSQAMKRVPVERTRLRFESLELRALLSTIVLESEPNNT